MIMSIKPSVKEMPPGTGTRGTPKFRTSKLKSSIVSGYKLQRHLAIKVVLIKKKKRQANIQK